MFDKLLAMLGMAPKKETEVSTEHAPTEVVEVPSVTTDNNDHKCNCGEAGCECQDGKCECAHDNQ